MSYSFHEASLASCAVLPSKLGTQVLSSGQHSNVQHLKMDSNSKIGQPMAHEVMFLPKCRLHVHERSDVTNMAAGLL